MVLDEVCLMKRVLIIEDVSFMRITLKSMLEKNGFMVVGEAPNGLEGIKKYIELKPDVVTMDITMPEVNGITALKKIKEIDPSAKVIMVSAMGQEGIVKEAILAGALGFLVKPIKEDALIKAINKL